MYAKELFDLASCKCYINMNKSETPAAKKCVQYKIVCGFVAMQYWPGEGFLLGKVF